MRHEVLMIACLLFFGSYSLQLVFDQPGTGISLTTPFSGQNELEI
jgi:hypothetical protein